MSYPTNTTAPDTSAKAVLTLNAADEGGHTVTIGGGFDVRGDYRAPVAVLFAGPLDACLDFMRRRIVDRTPKAVQACGFTPRPPLYGNTLDELAAKCAQRPVNGRAL